MESMILGQSSVIPALMNQPCAYWHFVHQQAKCNTPKWQLPRQETFHSNRVTCWLLWEEIHQELLQLERKRMDQEFNTTEPVKQKLNEFLLYILAKNDIQPRKSNALEADKGGIPLCSVSCVFYWAIVVEKNFKRPMKFFPVNIIWIAEFHYFHLWSLFIHGSVSNLDFMSDCNLLDSSNIK